MPRGRPTKYDPSYAQQVKHLCLLGATDRDIATAFGVDPSTVDNWKEKHPEFLRSLNEAKAEADAKVAQSLYRRALGFRHKAVKIFADPKTGAELIVPFVERYPPDTTAAIFWLKNRRPDLWRDRHEITGKDGAPVIPNVTLRLVSAKDDAGST